MAAEEKLEAMQKNIEQLNAEMKKMGGAITRHEIVVKVANEVGLEYLNEVVGAT